MLEELAHDYANYFKQADISKEVRKTNKKTTRNRVSNILDRQLNYF